MLKEFQIKEGGSPLLGIAMGTLKIPRQVPYSKW